MNSRKRAETAIERLAAPLSGLVGEPSLEAEEEDASTTGPTKAFDPQELSDEVRAAFTEMMDRHYRETLDEPVPFIGGETPRNAVKTEEGRRKVVDWLKFLETATARQRDLGTPYDLEWMWDELGLRDYRN